MDMQKTTNGYVCFYKDRRFELYAETSYQAQCACAVLLKLPEKKRHQITVVLAEKGGQPVAHDPASLG